MNKRQEVATYVLGAVLAGVSWYNGEHHGEWLFEYFVPLLLLGVLTIFGLRTRDDAKGPADRVLKGGLWILLAVVAFGYLNGRIHSAAYDASEAIEHADNQASDLDSRVDALEAVIHRLEFEINVLR